MGTHPIFESDFDCLTECLTVFTIPIGLIRIRVRDTLTKPMTKMHILDMINLNRIIRIHMAVTCTHQEIRKHHQRTCTQVDLKMNLHSWKNWESILIIFIKKQLLFLILGEQQIPKLLMNLTGPFVFCMALGAAMLMVGKVQFGYIYGIGAVGVMGMWTLLNLMAPKGAHVGVIASVLGYCILPIVILSVVNILIDLKGMVGTVTSIAAVLWCAISASKLFSDGLEMKRQQILVAYPCGILYAVFALLTVF